MRLLGFSLALPLLVAACGQSMQPFQNFDAGVGSDLSGSVGGGGGTGGGKDMAGGNSDGGTDGGNFDTTGPTILINSPTAGSFVNGFFTVSADVSDPSGVNPASVIAEFGNDPSSDITLQHTNGNTYEGTFDVHTLAKNYVLAEISVRAKDTANNLSQLGEEIVVDIVKPWMTMESTTTMRVAKHDPAMNLECSQLFSPIGTDAAHDGQVVPQLITLRARIEDHGNEAPGLAVERFSSIDPATVQMFVIHDDGQTVLAVDTDGDTYCDDVNPLLIPTAGPVMMQNEALSLQMVPMTAGGTPNYTQGGSATGCAEVGDAQTMTAPDRLCADAALGFSYELSYTGGPSIWTLPVYKAGDPIDCVGFQLDAANQLPEGPACVVTRASDKAGNVEVSFPLHICIDFGNHKCDGFSSTASHCTGVFDKTTMMLKPGTCIEPPTFSLATTPDGPNTFPPSGEIKFIGP